MLSTHVLPQWVGWVSIVYGLAGLGLVGFTGEAPPLLHYLMPLDGHPASPMMVSASN